MLPVPVVPQRYGMALMMLFKCKPIPDGLGTVELECLPFVGELMGIVGRFGPISRLLPEFALTSTQDFSRTLGSPELAGKFELDPTFDGLQKLWLFAALFSWASPN